MDGLLPPHSSISRNKNQAKKGPKKSKGGHTIIEVPTETTEYNTDRYNNTDLSNHDYDDNHGTNNHIRDINNPGAGNGSDSSNFSDGDPRRQHQNDKNQRTGQKRQQKEDKLAASQRNWDNKRQAFSLDDVYERVTKPGNSFDGIRIDAPINKNAAKLINDAQRSVNNDDHYSRHTKKKFARGRNHNTSSMAKLEGSGGKRGRLQKHQPYSPFAGRDIGNDDPLDVARFQQETSRKSSRGSSAEYTKKMGQNMDKITQAKFGNASMITKRRKKKSKARDEEVIDVDSDERNEGSEKKRKTSSYFAKSNDSFDSPNSSSANQGDDGYRVEGDWDSQGSGRRNDDVMAALDGANQYANFGSLRPQRDPKKKTYASKQRSSTKTPTPRFKLPTQNEKDEIEEFSDNDSSAARFGESKRSNNNSDNWFTSNRGRGGRTQEQKPNANGKRKQSNKTKKKLAKSGMLIDSDEEWKDAAKMSSLGSTNSNRQTRRKSRSRKAKKKDEVIEILDSSSEEESSEDEAISIDEKESKRSIAVQPKRNPPPIGDLFTIDAARIAVGKKVFKSKCELRFQFGAKKQYMRFSWNTKNGKEKEHTVSLKQDSELVGLNYYVPEENYNSENILTDGIDDSMTIIAFKIKPTDDNQFTIYTQSYDADSYVTVEVRDTDQFVAMLEQMRDNATLEPFLRSDPKIEFYELKEYTAALIKDTEEENNKRRRSTRLSRANAKRKSSTSDKPILVFPFKADDDEFFTAASKLNELKLAREQTSVEIERSIQPQDSDLNDPQAENENERVKGSARTHYITIREDDMERLEPGEFLNDSLVDFWMKWISGAPNNPNSDVHIFTSHFMSTLASDGPNAVSSWTAKKKIDIFEKKLIFVPVNSDLHWSLCVVVNPGFIANNYDDEIGNSRTEEGSFLLFLDSLKMHQKNRIAKNIHVWLNFEWRRLKKGGSKDLPKQPFDRTYMPVFTPTVPYQDNGCDCGVFVCRYAYNLFQMRNNCFSQFDMADDCRDLFEDSLFKFGMEDIARIRIEMETLIRNLAKVYQRMKKLEKAKKKESKSTSKEADGNSSNDAAAAEDTTDGGNKSEGVDESFDSNEDNLPTVKREDESRETSGDESPFVPKEKENVENSSDTSQKDDEVKNNEEGDSSSSSDNEKSQELLEDDESSVAC